MPVARNGWLFTTSSAAVAEAADPTASRSNHPPRTVTPFWDGRILLGLLIALYALHAWVRLAFTSAVEVDHAEQLVLSQQLQALYGLRQPPLYTWLLHSLEQVVGPMRANAVLLKYACFIGAWICYWRAARELGANPRLAGLSVLTLAWLYQVVWKLHHGITHTALLTLAACATLWLGLRLRTHQATRDYLALGLAIAIGILSKHGYWALLVCILVASWGDPGLRRAWMTPRIGLVALPVLLFAGPYLYALAHASHVLGAEYASTLKVGTDSTRLLAGLQNLCLALLGFLSPLWLLMLAAYLLVQRIGISLAPAAAWGERFLWRLNGLLLLTLVIMLLGGARSFVERWLHPFLLWLPLAFIFWSARRRLLEPGSPLSRTLIGGATVLLVTSLAYQTAQDVMGPPWCGKCRPLLNYHALANALQAQGLQDANVIAADEHIAANLRVALPGIRSVVPRYAYALANHRPDQACVLIWPGENGADPIQEMLALAGKWCNTRLAPVPPIYIGEDLESWRQRYPNWERHLPPPMEAQAYGWMVGRIPSDAGE